MNRVNYGLLAAVVLLLGVGVYFLDDLAGSRASKPAQIPITSAPEPAAAYAKRLLAFWEKELERDPFNFIAVQKIAEAELSLARAEGDERRYFKAEQLLRRAESFTPKTDSYRLLLLGRTLMARHRFAEALEIVERVDSLEPQNSAAGTLRMDALLGIGRYKEAFDYLESFHERSPGFASWVRMAEMHSLEGDYEKQLDALLEAQRIYAGEDTEPTAWIQTQIGIFYMEHERYDEAEEAFQDVLIRSPDYYVALEHLAELRERRGELAEEAEYLKRTLRLNRSPQFVLRMARVEAALGNAVIAESLSEEADEELGRRSEADPPAYARDMAERLIEKGEASERLMELVQVDLLHRPGDLRSNFVAARACRLFGDLSCASSYIKKSLRLEGARPEYLKEAALIEMGVEG